MSEWKPVFAPPPAERPGLLLVGLTGGIATGKSTVAGLLRQLDIPVVDADVAARKVVEPGQPGLAEIKAAFGSQVITAQGQLDRKQLGQIIFADAEARQRLNDILHPRIRAWMRQQVEQIVNGREPQDRQLVVLDIPLLFESGLQQTVDEVWVVSAPAGVEHKRLMARDQLSSEEAQQRIDSQWPLEKKRALATVVIDNGASLQETARQLAGVLVERGLDLEPQPFELPKLDQ